MMVGLLASSSRIEWEIFSSMGAGFAFANSHEISKAYGFLDIPTFSG